MKSAFDSQYDSGTCYELYLEYEDGDDSKLNDLLIHLCPLIRKCYRFEVSGEQGADQSIIEGEALEALYRVIQTKSIPTYYVESFSRYLSTVIVRSMRTSLVKLNREVFDFQSVAKRPYYHRSDYQAVEARIYREQLNREIYDIGITRIRFIDKEGDACQFLLECHLGFKNLDPFSVRSKYLLTSQRSRYLQRYVGILVKSITLEIMENERRSGTFSSDWETGGDLLRTTSQLR